MRHQRTVSVARKPPYTCAAFEAAGLERLGTTDDAAFWCEQRPAGRGAQVKGEHRRGHATAFSTFWSLRVNACMPAIKRPFMLTRLIALPRCSWRMLCPFDLVWAVARAALQHRREVTADC